MKQRVRIWAPSSACWAASALCLAPMGLCASAEAASAPPPAPAAEEPVASVQLRAARERLEQAARDVAELSMQAADGVGARVFRWQQRLAPRAMLGVNIAGRPGEGALDRGVQIWNVSPGGPAEAAGLKARDVIVTLDGKLLAKEGSQSAAEKLLAIMADAETGKPISLTYERDGKSHSVQVTPRSMAGGNLDLAFSGPGQRVFEAFDLPGMIGTGRGGRGFGSAELAELSPELGKYFGTEQGLLVVRAPKDERYKLRDGDVLLDIDGRVPGSVAHAYQILRSYRAGEKAKLRVMRQKSRTELLVEMPAGD